MLRYCNYGNRTKKGSTVYKYTRSNLLESFNGIANYTYAYNGVRYTKTVNGITTTYIYDGNKLLGEDRSDGKKLRYFYDAQGICGFRYNNNGSVRDIIYVKNALGDVVYLKDSSGNVLAKYEYDAWGNCTTIMDKDGIGTLNPIRYRSYYYDTESELYYLMTRYYDPETNTFLTRDSIEYLDPETLGGVDLYAYRCNMSMMQIDLSDRYLKSVGNASRNSVGDSSRNWSNKTFGTTRTRVQFTVDQNESIDFLFFGLEVGVDNSVLESGEAKPITFTLTHTGKWWEFWKFKVGVSINIGKFNYSLGIGIGEISSSIGYGSFSLSFVGGFDKVGMALSYTQDNTTSYAQAYIRTLPTLALALAVAFSSSLVSALLWLKLQAWVRP